MEVKENYSLRRLNTFGIDITADYYYETDSADELKLIFDGSYKKILILGGGSNILFTEDYKGLVVRYLEKSITITNEDEDYLYIRAGAGAEWDDVVSCSVDKGAGGIENLALIPGKAGAAPIQNIGAYGQELKDTFYYLEGFNRADLEDRRYYKEECRFGYRDSIFKRELKDKFVITSVVLKLRKNPVLNTSYGAIEEELRNQGITNPTVKDVSMAVKSIRESKLPDPKKLGNAGSFFKNPEVADEVFFKLKEEYTNIPGYPAGEGKVKLAAGWLIEKAGLRGYRDGAKGTHEKQALVIVNYGGAEGREIAEFKDKIKYGVKAKFGIELEEEVNIL